MTHRLSWFSAALVALGVSALSSSALASSHREAPAISQDPVADSTDLWAWNTGDAKTGTLHLAVSYNPMEEPAGGPNFHSFGDDVLYEVHVARGSASLDDVVTYQFHFKTAAAPTVDVTDLKAAVGGGKEFFYQLSGKKQTYDVVEIKGGVATTLASNLEVAPANIGPATNKIAYGLADTTKAGYEAFALGKAGSFSYGGGTAKVWAGPRDDGFYVDLGGIFDLANLHALNPKDTPRDNVAGFNTHTISFAIPAAALPTVDAGDKFKDRIGVWTSASRRKVSVLRSDGTKQGFGPWVQVSRLGVPLVNEAVIGLQDKDKYSRTLPKNDVNNFGGYILNPIIVRDAEAVGIYAALGVDPTALKSQRLDVVAAINIGSDPTAADGFPLSATGDVLRVDFGLPAGFPNGRPLGPAANGGKDQTENDVTDVLLSLLLTGKTSGISDGVSANDAKYTDTIPYLGTPWTGFDEGHGAAAPAQKLDRARAPRSGGASVDWFPETGAWYPTRRSCFVGSPR
jgi:hypothetical protein